MNEGRHTDATRPRVAGAEDRSSSFKRATSPADAIHALARPVAIATAESRASPVALVAAVKAELLGLVVEDPAFRLREANHRFKNEMQMLASGIQRMLYPPSQPGARDCLRCLGRVIGMAQVHSALEEVTGDRVPLAPFLRDLASKLIAASGMDDQVMLRFELTPLTVGPDAASSIALFLNEAMVNALKHGFPAGRRGKIAVALRRNGADGRLVVQDDGAGRAGRLPHAA